MSLLCSIDLTSGYSSVSHFAVGRWNKKNRVEHHGQRSSMGPEPLRWLASPQVSFWSERPPLATAPALKEHCAVLEREIILIYKLCIMRKRYIHTQKYINVLFFCFFSPISEKTRCSQKKIRSQNTVRSQKCGRVRHIQYKQSETVQNCFFLVQFIQSWDQRELDYLVCLGNTKSVSEDVSLLIKMLL